MKVYQAESGVSLPLRDFATTESIDDLRQEIHTLTSIPPHAQILLTASGLQLKPEMLAEIFNGGSGSKDGLVIYLFNRLLLDPKSASAAMMPISPDVEPPVPQNVLVPLRTSESVSMDDRCDAYAEAFRSHVKFGQATLTTANYHSTMCERLLNEQKAQGEALRIALSNLKGHSRSVCESFDAFYLHAQKEMAKHASRILSFPTDMQALHRLPIHASITEGDKYLSDYVPEDKLLTWADNCQVAHEQLVRKVGEAAEVIKSIRAGTDAESSQPAEVNLRQLEGHLVEVRDGRQRLESKYQRLERDLGKVEDTLIDIRSSPLSVASDKFTSLNHLYKIHRDEYLPRIIEIDASIRSITGVFIKSKVHLSRQLVNRLQFISHLQSQIASVTPTISNLANIVNTHVQAFSQLLHVHRMPAAWGAALVEVVRRREFLRVFFAKCQDMAEVLARFRIQEEKRRETFKTEIGRYLPAGVITGLDDKPPYCEVSLSNTKDNLPNISREDIADFEKLVTSIHSSMVESEAGGPSASQTHSNHTISKLIATMVKMSSQVDATPNDFERILSRSGFSERMLRLEEDNARLRSQLSAYGQGDIQQRPLGRSPSSGPSGMRDAELMTLRSKLADYEARCAILEARNQERDILASRLAQTEEALDAEKKHSAHLEATVNQMVEETNTLQKAKEEATSRATNLDQQYTTVQSELDKMRNFLHELREGLTECSRNLQRSTENLVSTPKGEVTSPTSPANRLTDEIKRTLRELQDDILSHAAELAGLREAVRDRSDDEASESLEGEIVALATQVASLRANLQTCHIEMAELREQLTVAEAREAVTEADLNSVRALLKRAEEDIGREREKVKAKEQELGESREHAKELEDKELQMKERMNALETQETQSESLINGLKEQLQAKSMGNDGLKQKLQDAEKELDTARASVEKTLEQITARQQEIDNLRAENLHAVRKLEQSATALQAKEEESKAISAEYITFKRTAEEQLNSVQNRLTEMEHEVKQKEEQITELRTQLETANKALKDATQRCLDAEQRFNSQQDECEELGSKVAALGEQLAQKSKSAVTLQAKLTESQCEVETLRSEMDMLRGRLHNQESQEKATSTEAEPVREVSEVDSAVLDMVKEHVDKWRRASQKLLDRLRSLSDTSYDAANRICGQTTAAERILAEQNLYKDMTSMLDNAGDTSNPTIAEWVTTMDHMVDDLLEKLDKADADQDLKSTWSQLLERWKDVVERELPGMREAYKRCREAEANKITFKNFRPGDLALFLPTRHPKAWAAFNVNSPHYFLSPESGHNFAERMKNRDYILAYITETKEYNVDPADPASNPFGLASRTRYRLCTVRAWDGKK